MLQDELATALGLKKSQLSKFKKRGCPMDDVGKARCWINANIRRKAPPAGEVLTDIPPVEVPAPEGAYSWEARLERARRMELQIYEAAKVSVSSPMAGQLQSLLSSYTKSVEAIAELEKTARESRIAAGELIHRDTARAILMEVFQPIQKALDNLPMTERSRCNPQNPKVAEEALRAWKDALLLRLSQSETRF